LLYKYAFYVAPYPVVATIALGCGGATVLGLVRGRSITRFPLTGAALGLYAVLQLRVVLASLDESKLADSMAPTVVAAVALAGSAIPNIADRRLSTRSGGRLGATLASLAVACLVLFAAQRQLHTRIHQPTVASSTAGGILSGIPVAGASPPWTTVAELKRVTSYIAAHTTNEQEIFVAPTQPLIYYLAGRDNATSYDYLDPLYTTRTVDARITAQLAEKMPRLIVLASNTFADTGLSGPDLAPQTYAWVAENYRIVTGIGAFTILAPSR
jgi:hypothetical protein